MALILLTYGNLPRSDDPQEPCAGLAVAGLSLLEHAVHSAGLAGVAGAIVLADSLPPAFATTLEQMQPPIPTELTRHGGELRNLLRDGDRLLVIDEGFLFEPDVLLAILTPFVNGHQARLATRPAADMAGDLRLDSARARAGLALYSGALVRRICAGLGDWDLAATLPRVAAGEGVAEYVHLSALAGSEDLPAQVLNTPQAQRLDHQLAEALPVRAQAWPLRQLEQLADLLALRSARLGWLQPQALGAGLLLMVLAAAGLLVVGQVLWALGLIIGIGFVRRAEATLTKVRRARLSGQRWRGLAGRALPFFWIGLLAAGLLLSGSASRLVDIACLTAGIIGAAALGLLKDFSTQLPVVGKASWHVRVIGGFDRHLSASVGTTPWLLLLALPAGGMTVMVWTLLAHVQVSLLVRAWMLRQTN